MLDCVCFAEICEGPSVVGIANKQKEIGNAARKTSSDHSKIKNNDKNVIPKNMDESKKDLNFHLFFRMIGLN